MAAAGEVGTGDEVLEDITEEEKDGNSRCPKGIGDGLGL